MPDRVSRVGGRRRFPLTDYVAIFCTLIGVGVLAALVYTARTALLLVFVGFFLALGLEPLIRAAERRRVPRGLAVALVILVFLAVVTALVLVLVIPAVNELSDLINDVPDRLRAVGSQLPAFSATAGDPDHHRDLASGLDTVRQFIGESLSAVFGVLGVVAGGLFSLFTVLALLLYFSTAMPRIIRRMGSLLGSAERADLLERAFGKVGGYVTGQALLSLIAGSSAYVFFLIIDLPYPALLALITAFFDAIPQVGATLGAIVVSVVALSVSLPLALRVVAYFIAYQGLENYILSPRIFSKTIELAPVTAFLAVLIGATVGGLLGAMVALPLTAAIGEVVKYAWRHRPRPPGATSQEELPA